MVLLGVKELDDLKIIWKQLTHGRYPVEKICLPKKDFFGFLIFVTQVSIS